MSACASMRHQNTGNNASLAWEHFKTSILHSPQQRVLQNNIFIQTMPNIPLSLYLAQWEMSIRMMHIEQGLGAVTALGWFLDKQRRSADGTGEVISSALLQPVT